MSPIMRRIWFYGTWCLLIVRSVLVVAVILLFVVIGAADLWRWHIWSGMVLLLLAAGLAWVSARGVIRFRADLHSGMQSELKRRHCCPHCMYDLRGSVEYCPECGYRILPTIEL